jgi:hypothetical protein
MLACNLKVEGRRLNNLNHTIQHNMNNVCLKYDTILRNVKHQRDNFQHKKGMNAEN